MGKLCTKMCVLDIIFQHFIRNKALKPCMSPSPRPRFDLSCYIELCGLSASLDTRNVLAWFVTWASLSWSWEEEDTPSGTWLAAGPWRHPSSSTPPSPPSSPDPPSPLSCPTSHLPRTGPHPQQEMNWSNPCPPSDPPQ